MDLSRDCHLSYLPVGKRCFDRLDHLDYVQKSCKPHIYSSERPAPTASSASHLSQSSPPHRSTSVHIIEDDRLGETPSPLVADGGQSQNDFKITSPLIKNGVAPSPSVDNGGLMSPRAVDDGGITSHHVTDGERSRKTGDTVENGGLPSPRVTDGGRSQRTGKPHRG